MEWDGMPLDAAGCKEGRLGCERRERRTKAKALAGWVPASGRRRRVGWLDGVQIPPGQGI